MNDRLIAFVMMFLGITELFEGDLLLSAILILIAVGKYLSEYANKHKRKKSKNNKWLKASLLITTIGLSLVVVRTITFLEKVLKLG